MNVAEVKITFDTRADSSREVEDQLDQVVLAIEALGFVEGEIDITATGPVDREKIIVESVTEREIET